MVAVDVSTKLQVQIIGVDNLIMISLVKSKQEHSSLIKIHKKTVSMLTLYRNITLHMQDPSSPFLTIFSLPLGYYARDGTGLHYS